MKTLSLASMRTSRSGLYAGRIDDESGDRIRKLLAPRLGQHVGMVRGVIEAGDGLYVNVPAEDEFSLSLEFECFGGHNRVVLECLARVDDVGIILDGDTVSVVDNITWKPERGWTARYTVQCVDGRLSVTMRA